MNRIGTFLVLLLLGNSFLSLSQASEVGKKSKMLNDCIQVNHFDAKKMDDSLSSFIFETFFEDIDPGGMFFLVSDIENFEKYRYSLDEEISGKQHVFFSAVANIYKERLEFARTQITELETLKLDFGKDESVNLDDGELWKPCNSEEELKDKWRLWAKYSVLDEMFDYEYVDDIVNAPIDSILARVSDAQQYIIQDEHLFIKSFLDNPNGYENYLGTFYLDAIAKSFDPHTTYFSPVEKERYEEDLSGSSFEFGFSLEEDDEGKISIASLMPGSPAWNCGDLNTGDQIIAMELDGSKKVDLRKKNLDDLTVMMYNLNPESVVMKVVKQSGDVESVKLTKGEVYVEEDVIKSLILEGDKKIGYITLPDFYTDWDDESGLGCANDMAKVIVKLQKENIEGLILDMRNNGGGSLREAIDLGGIFIDWGPLSVYKAKNEKPFSLKDMNKGSIYNGPLLILVNGLSASATEIFSAAMQDYNRALVVGSNTYGKATGQVILPVDPLGSDAYGFVKVTTSKYYRINNGTHQKLGVKPHVAIEDIYELYDYSESSNPNPLPSDSVVKKLYFTPAADFKVGQLSGNSAARLKSNDQFQRLMVVLDSVESTDVWKGTVSLSVEGYQKSQREFDELLGDLFDEESYQSENFKATNNQFDKEIIQLNEYRRELNDKYLQKIQSDLYIEEAYNILMDQIRLSNN